jgi:8-oxo-dGTP pyrophosphatase MutT (NUDIX family)
MERFVRCARGCRHWGALGAAGLLFRVPAPADPRYLLVLRHRMSHHGGTWALPGGALLAGEAALTGALREAEEELGPLPAALAPSPSPALTYVDDHGRWSYTTHVLDVPTPFTPTATNWETAGWRWVSAPEALSLPLLPALQAAWPTLTARPAAAPGLPVARPASAPGVPVAGSPPPGP